MIIIFKESESLIATISSFLAIVSFAIYIISKIIEFWKTRNPIKDIYLSENIDWKKNPTNLSTDSGKDFTFKVNLLTRVNNVIIEQINMYVDHGMGPKSYLKFIDSKETIYMYSSFFDVKNYRKDHFNKCQSRFDVKYVKIKKIKNSNYAKKISEINKYIKENNISEEAIEKYFPTIYLKVRVNGVIAEYYICAYLFDHPRS